jgi:hypothetical protein
MLSPDSVGHLDLPSAEHVAERGPMRVLHVDCAWGERAAQDADLSVLVKVFAELLALPLYRKRVWNILGRGRERGSDEPEKDDKNRELGRQGFSSLEPS